MSVNYTKIILVISVICVLVLIGVYLFQPKTNVCLSSVCVTEAAYLLRAIDSSVSPCDDFYGFVCGKWIQNTVLPDDKAYVDQYGLLQDNLNDKLKGLINRIDYEKEKNQFVRNVKSLYESCHNTTLLESLGDKPLRDLLDRLGGWPVLGRWTHTKWDDLTIKLFNEGHFEEPLFSLSLSQDPTNTSRMIATIDQPSFGVGDREHVVKGPKDPVVIAYKNMMLKAITSLSDRVTDRTIVEDMFSFEYLLANNSMADELRRNVTKITDKMTVRQLTRLSPNINWIKIFREIISKDFSEDEEIISYDINYLKFLSNTLPKYSDEAIANLMIWRAVHSSMKSLNDHWFRISEEFGSVKYGTKSRRPRSDHCVKVTRQMSTAISHLYIKNFFDDTNKNKAVEVTRNVVKAFRQSLITNEWMVGKTRMEALKKLDNMALEVGYPEQLSNETLIAEYYGNLRLDPNDYFGNSARLDKWSSRMRFDKYRQPVVRLDWRLLAYVAVVNAFFTHNKNMVRMPAGFLQGVFFHKDRPDYLNYGAYGSTAGHEISHGFDDRGRQFDSEGNVRNWWDPTTDRLYRSKAQCFVEQYSNFTVEEIGQNLNGIITQGENIADNVGVITAYRAYVSYANPSEPQLPGLDYTPEQLFWISSGLQECQKSTIESQKSDVLVSSHSPGRFRVNGYSMNSAEFSSVFNCPVDSPMNPRHKCRLW